MTEYDAQRDVDAGVRVIGGHLRPVLADVRVEALVATSAPNTESTLSNTFMASSFATAHREHIVAAGWLTRSFRHATAETPRSQQVCVG